MSSPATSLAPRAVRHEEAVMGTVVTFDVVLPADRSTEELYVALASARAALHRADAVFSLWKPNSPMSAVRRGELSVADAPPEVGEILALCRRFRELTEGWFDAEALPGGVDPTGLVKGWALRRALGALTDAGFADAMVNGGGDIATSGSPKRGERWRVGIQHPLLRRSLLAVVEIDGAIATSGTYERGAHLYDPFRRRYRAAYVSATVLGADLVVADALATGLAVAGPAGMSFIDTLDGYEALAVAENGVAQRSAGFTSGRLFSTAE